MNQTFESLDRLRILDLTDRWGHFAGKILTDLGADVVLAEPPGGHPTRQTWPLTMTDDGRSASVYFWHFHQGKRSVLWDTGTEEGLRQCSDLIRAAHVVLTGREAYLDIRERLPASLDETPLVVISAYGLSSPDALRDNDLHVSAASGTAGLSGYGSRDRSSPLIPPGEQAMHSAGLYGAIAALLAIRLRRVGVVDVLDISAQAAAFQGTEQLFPYAAYRHEELHRQGGGYATVQPTPKWQLTAADGRLVYCFGLLPGTQKSWDGLREWMRREGAAQDLDSPEYDNLSDLRGSSNFSITPKGMHASEVISRFVESMDAEVIYRQGQKLGLTWARIFQPEETLTDEQFHVRNFFRSTRMPGSDSTYVTPSLPWSLTDTEKSPNGPAIVEPPEFGQHTEAVLTEWTARSMPRQTGEDAANGKNQ